MRENNKIPSRNIIDLFKNYYKLGIHQFIGLTGHAIMTGLLYKFNELRFPDNLKISIKEMFALSGISDIRTLRNARTQLTSYRHDENDPDSWVVNYYENSVKEYGTYEINYVILLENYCNNTGELQDNSSNVTVKKTDLGQTVRDKSVKNALLSNTILDHTNQTIKNQTKPDTRVDNLTKVEGEISQKSFQLVGFEYKGLNKEQISYLAKWYQEGRADQIVKYFGQAVMDAIEEWRKSDENV